MKIGNSFLQSKPIYILEGQYPKEILDWHQHYEDGPTWRISREGMIVGIHRPGITIKNIPRSKGEPQTVRRIMADHGKIVKLWAEEYGVPLDIIVACIATETGGAPAARRQEPGWITDKLTPHRVSTGLMQTLISTAQRMVPDAVVTSKWLENPYNSIKAGVAYIKHQSKKTKFDPPLVASAYNAGGLYRQNGEKNDWKLRNYPIGTSKHVDRFVEFFNDSFSQDWGKG
jgi:hypothetical protein